MVIYLSLGTNTGNREQNLRMSLQKLEDIMTITMVSKVYETEPWGYTNQPPFLNMCVGGSTSFTPHDFLARAKQIELELGREPSVRWGPRLIDIDVLYYDDLVIGDDSIEIPHREIEVRAFVLAPLRDIAPDFVHPILGLTTMQMLEQVGEEGVQPTDLLRNLQR